MGAAGLVAGAAAALSGALAPATAAATAPTFDAQASATGLEVNLFGNEISGGNATVSADSSAPKAHAEGTGTLLTSAGAQTDDVSDASGVSSGQSKPFACAQGGGTPAGTPLLLSASLGCASSSAAVDGGGWPVAAAQGEVGELDVGVNGILQPVLSGASQLTQGLASGLGTCASSAGSNPLGQLCSGLAQVVTNLQDTVTAAGSVDQPDVVVKLGPASASIANAGSGGGGATPVTVTAEGASADIQVLPGVGSTAATFTGGALSGVLSGAPLIEVKVTPATATSTYNGTAWSSVSHSSVATITLNIPGDVQTIDLSAPGQCQELAAGTPLDSTVCLSAASTQTGSADAGAAQADSVKADLLTAVPGAPGKGVQLNLGDVTTSAGAPPPATSPAPPGTVPPVP
ncbi:MAG TPA: hypothetical protein VLZ77_10115, partial [Acidimicrobiales bacterium]|nr:hypothetical protein [Acidimicrobiales bacterium]